MIVDCELRCQTVADMFYIGAIVFSVVLIVTSSTDLEFPPGFKFGAATAAFQVEGAWNISGKSESIWDRFTHSHPERIKDGSNGDVACDSYHLWRRDVEIAKELGLDFYRFSISWPRLLPSGFSNKLNEDGKNYYNNLIDDLLRNGIEPVVTLYHWDLPQRLQDLGGWTNPHIAEWFSEYARVAFTLFADRVKTWITINEPIIICDVAYTGIHAPGLRNIEVAPYICNKNILLAHAKAWRIYDEEFRAKYHGQISISNQLLWFEPATPEDEELAQLAREHMAGRFSHPIFSKQGGWPPTIEKIMAENSKKEGYHRSRLPSFTKEEKKLIKGTYDFYGFNHYTSRLVRKAKDGEVPAHWPFLGAPELGAILESHPDWKQAASFWFTVNPEGIRRQLAWLKKMYGDVNIFITENGCATIGSELKDDDRVEYYNDYLKQILLAIKEDGVNVTGYTAWTLIDNFEWSEGYEPKFGLYEVDFSSPERTRTPRKSARFYASVIKHHSLNIPANYNKDELYIFVLICYFF